MLPVSGHSTVIWLELNSSFLYQLFYYHFWMFEVVESITLCLMSINLNCIPVIVSTYCYLTVSF